MKQKLAREKNQRERKRSKKITFEKHPENDLGFLPHKNIIEENYQGIKKTRMKK